MDECKPLVLGRERKRKRQLDAFGGGAAGGGGGGGGRAWHVLLATSHHAVLATS